MQKAYQTALLQYLTGCAPRALIGLLMNIPNSDKQS